jgi:hypothetical protein
VSCNPMPPESYQATEVPADEIAIDISYGFGPGAVQGEKEAKLRKNIWSTVIGPEDKAGSYLMLGRVNEQPQGVIFIELMVLNTNQSQVIMAMPQIATRLNTTARITIGGAETPLESGMLDVSMTPRRP